MGRDNGRRVRRRRYLLVLLHVTSQESLYTQQHPVSLTHEISIGVSLPSTQPVTTRGTVGLHSVSDRRQSTLAARLTTFYSLPWQVRQKSNPFKLFAVFSATIHSFIHSFITRIHEYYYSVISLTSF